MADERLTYFDLPVAPEAFGVLLPPADLRRLRFTALDYQSLRRAAIEYIRAYYPDEFNDFVAHNGLVMVLEIVAGIASRVALRGDLNARECTLPTATTEAAVANHLALINQRIRRQTPAVAEFEIALANPVISPVQIDAGLTLRTNGPDGQPVYYELYKAPGDFASSLVIPANKRGIIVYGIEGTFASPVVVVSGGGPNQSYTVSDPTMLEAPIVVTVSGGGATETWRIINEPIERFGPRDKVVEVVFLGEAAIFRFGDNVNGAAPLSGQTITIRYRTGGGVRGRIVAGQISETRQVNPLPPVNAPVTVTIRNLTPSSGGADRETIDEAKRRAPRDFAVHRSIVTAGDYAQVARTFAHPVFGSVSKAVAVARTAQNANRVEIYCLAAGPGGTVVTPSAGLKVGMATYFDELNVLTDQVFVMNGAIKAVDIEATVIVNRSADASVVSKRVENVVVEFFNLANWEMGQPLHLSTLYEAIQRVDGVAYVDIFKPADNILPTGLPADPQAPGVGFNELIVLGQRNIQYFYEKGKV